MRLISIEPRPESRFVEPALLLDVMIAYPMGLKAPLDLLVTVRAGDRIIGTARSSTFGLGMTTLESAAEGRKDRDQEQTQKWSTVLALSARVLDFLEDLRSKDRKRDVVLQCDVEIQALVSNVVTAHIRTGGEVADGRGGKAEMLTYKYDPNFRPDYTNMWVLSGDGGRVFLRCEGTRFQTSITISASDWVHEYLEVWSMTRYVVIELPQPEVLTANSHIEERVSAAIGAVGKASESLAKGDWDDVLKELRPVWELIRNQSDIETLLRNDGYIDEAIKAFNESIKHQFTLASKFVHRVDTSGKAVLPDMHVLKEDAYLCYSFALSILNLVTRKMRRQARTISSSS